MRRGELVLPLLFPGPRPRSDRQSNAARVEHHMVTFALGMWLGGAVGVCVMGALWAQERRTRLFATDLD